MDEGPIAAAHGVVRWRACDLIMRLHEEFGISGSDDTVYRALKELGFSHLSARPRAYKQDPEAMLAFKKTFPPAWRSHCSLLRWFASTGAATRCWQRSPSNALGRRTPRAKFWTFSSTTAAANNKKRKLTSRAARKTPFTE